MTGTFRVVGDPGSTFAELRDRPRREPGNAWTGSVSPGSARARGFADLVPGNRGPGKACTSSGCRSPSRGSSWSSRSVSCMSRPARPRRDIRGPRPGSPPRAVSVGENAGMATGASSTTTTTTFPCPASPPCSRRCRTTRTRCSSTTRSRCGSRKRARADRAARRLLSVAPAVEEAWREGQWRNAGHSGHDRAPWHASSSP